MSFIMYLRARDQARENMVEDDQGAVDPDKGKGTVLSKVFCIIFTTIVIAGVIAASALLSRPHDKVSHSTGRILKRADWICNGELGNETWVEEMCKDLKYFQKPCERFEQYCCDAWGKRTNIPNGIDSWTRFEETGRSLFKLIRQMFDSYNILGSAEGKAKRYFDQCIKQDARSDVMNNLRSLKSYLTKIKGTRLNSISNTNRISTVLSKIHQHGIWTLFKVSVGIHPRDPSKHILQIGPGPLPFSDSLTEMGSNKLYLAVPKRRNHIDISISDSSEIISPEEDIASSRVDEIMDSKMKINKALLRIFWGMSNKCFPWDMYLSFSNYPCKSEVERKADNIQNLAVNISLAVIKNVDTKSKSYTSQFPNKLINKTYLQTKCSTINWDQYFNIMADKFNLLNLEILLLDEKAFLAVCAVVSKYVADGDSNLVTNYMLLVLAREILGNFDSQLLVDDKYFVDKLRQNYDTNHWYRCMIRTNKVLGMAIGSMYIRNVTTEDKDHENKLKDVKEIVTHIKQAYKYFIFNGTWIDNETRKRAFTKIDLMVDKIGYPVEIMNVTYRDELSSEFEMFYTWFYTFVESMKFVVQQNLNKVWEPVNRKRWNLTPATVNAVHDLFFNDINIPMSLFQLPFYSPNRPTIMNYGGLGSIIGHEIMHAFGKSGSFHDEYGRYEHWLNVRTETKLTSKSQCLIDNYSKFDIKGYRGNSKFTNDEDISDTVGLRAAYYAYQLFKPKDKFDNETVWWMKTHKFNEDRLFFVAFAQIFCEKFTTDGLRSLVSTHSPGPFRIKGALSDSSYFKEAFSCTNYSPYVFKNRCHVW